MLSLLDMSRNLRKTFSVLNHRNLKALISLSTSWYSLGSITIADRKNALFGSLWRFLYVGEPYSSVKIYSTRYPLLTWRICTKSLSNDTISKKGNSKWSDTSLSLAKYSKSRSSRGRSSLSYRIFPVIENDSYYGIPVLTLLSEKRLLLSISLAQSAASLKFFSWQTRFFGEPGLVASRSEVMLPQAGSDARWREEVMPGRPSGEVMLTLTRQEAKNQRKRDLGTRSRTGALRDDGFFLF